MMRYVTPMLLPFVLTALGGCSSADPMDPNWQDPDTAPGHVYISGNVERPGAYTISRAEWADRLVIGAGVVEPVEGRTVLTIARDVDGQTHRIKVPFRPATDPDRPRVLVKAGDTIEVSHAR